MTISIGLAVDALSPSLTGVGRYCWELASRLHDEPDIGCVTYWRGNEQILHPAQLLRGEGLGLRPYTRLRRWALRRARNMGVLNESALWPKHHGVELFHGPNFMLPRWVESGVITVHDLSVFLFPETHPVARIRAFEQDFKDSLSRARRIITPSQAIRRELAEFAGIDLGLITAIPMGVHGAFAPVRESELQAVLTRLRLPKDGYGLTLATLEPRKRIDLLLAAWRVLPDNLRTRYPLVIAGASGWKNASLRAQIDEAVAEGWAIFLGYVADTDLPALYSGARLFAYPSIYEGFGLPPIEAMACGVPVVVANCSCLPEITGGAAALIAPEDIEGTAVKLANALVDDAWRALAIDLGLKVASGYSWERCIRKTVALYEQAFDS